MGSRATNGDGERADERRATFSPHFATERSQREKLWDRSTFKEPTLVAIYEVFEHSKMTDDASY